MDTIKHTPIHDAWEANVREQNKWAFLNLNVSPHKVNSYLPIREIISPSPSSAINIL